MRYKLVIFDMDGTTLYTLQDLADGLNRALKMNGYPPKNIREIRSYVGNGIRNEVRCSLPAGTDDAVLEKVYEDFNAWYNIHCGDHTRPYDGIIPLLHQLRDSHIKTAVVSNKGDLAVKELNDQYFEGLFDIGIGEREDEGIARKPAPDMVNEVLKQLDIDRKDAVYTGDSEVDIETARNAEMDCIIVDWGYRDRNFLIQKGAKVIVSSPKELWAALQNA